MNIVVLGMGYVGIPCAVLFADVPGFQVTGIQRRSERSGWKIDCLNGGKSPFEGDEPGLAGRPLQPGTLVVIQATGVPGTTWTPVAPALERK